MTRTKARPLIVTADTDLLDDLLRVVAAAGVEADVAADFPAARLGYGAAPLVVLGSDVSAQGLRVPPARRAGVVIACRAHNDPQAWDLAYDVGAEHVAVLPNGEEWLRQRLSTALHPKPSGGKVFAVLGGRGGAGASVLAAALSVTAVRQGRRTLLVDADPLGGGIDLLFGWELEHGLRWPQLAETGGGVDSQTLVSALPNRGDLVLLSCDRSEPSDQDSVAGLMPDVMQVVLDAGREGRDIVVVDLPRHLDGAAECVLRAADRALMVVTPELRATAAAARVAGSVLAHRNELSIVLRDTAPARINAAEVAKTLDLPLAGRLRTEPRLPGAIERGEPPGANPRGPLAGLCQRLLREALA